MARAVEDAGADSLSLINTITGMVIDVGKKRPVLGSVVGGLSGPAIRPVALRMVYEAAGAVDIPVVGIGGISETDDALQFLIAGAAAVQVGTATFLDPSAPVSILEGIRSYISDGGMSDLSEIVNSLELE
jgi:dihydroorotate dehydrogenase (NAD+) catalytic subunit